MMQCNEKQNFDAIDCLRILLAASVVFCHVVTDVPVWLNTMTCHLPVPVFFLISSYFFFRKEQLAGDDRKAKKQVLTSFLWRILRLYLCWEIVQLPITLKQWIGKDYGLGAGLLKFLKAFFLSGTFFASWYLMALLLGTLLVFLLGKRFGNGGLMEIGLVLYLFCCGCSGYHGLLNFSAPGFYAPTSFVMAIMWIAIGKTIAEGGAMCDRFRSRSLGIKLAMLGLAILLFFLESGLCKRMGWFYRTDAFLSYLLICPMIFLIFLDLNFTCSCAKPLRSISTVTYCFHGTVFAVMISIGNRLGVNFEVLPYDLVCYICVLFFCGIVGWGLFRLRSIRGFGWLEWFC